MEREIQDMHAAIENEEREISLMIEQEEAREAAFESDRANMALRRGARL
jgi:hypothetical protein